MKQSDLNRAVAASLGETISTIASRGFSLVSDSMDERDPLVVDFDDMSQPTPLPLLDAVN
ncbi:MAG: hypothetical protein RIC55_20370 [Pirellulaceae bacterium]